MSLSGIIPFGGEPSYAGGIHGPLPVGMCFIIAQDGTHHAMGGTALSIKLLGCGETLDLEFSVTDATYAADIDTQFAGLVDSTDCFGITHTISCPGTPDFIIMTWCNPNTISGVNEIIGLRYRVASPGSVSVVGKYRYCYDAIGNLAGNNAGAVGCRVIGNRVYFCADYGNFFFGFDQCLTWLPLDSDGIDLTAESWLGQRAFLPDAPDGMFSTAYWIQENSASIYPHADGVGVLSYRSLSSGESPSIIEHTVVPEEAGGGVLVPPLAVADISALFDLPFADENLNFDGVADSVDAHRYRSPSVNVLADGRIEFIFIRGYDDHPNWLGVRRFIASNDLSEVETFPFSRFQMTDIIPTSFVTAHAYREGNEVIWMIRDNPAFIFGTTTLLVNPVGSETRIVGF